MTPTDLIEKYELPEEYWDAIFEAYKAGFLEGSIRTFNDSLKDEILHS